MRMQVQSLASFSGSGIQHCHELWYRPKMWSDPKLLWLGVGLSFSSSSNLTLAWELPCAASAAIKRKKKRINYINVYFYMYEETLGR